MDPKERQNLRAEIEGIVQGLSDASAPNGRQRLAIALTKHDAVAMSARKQPAMKVFHQIVATIGKRFASRFAEIKAFVTAASPKKTGAPRCEGLPELLTVLAQTRRRPSSGSRRPAIVGSRFQPVEGTRRVTGGGVHPVSILGLPGSGKTTFLKVIDGMSNSLG